MPDYLPNQSRIVRVYKNSPPGCPVCGRSILAKEDGGDVIALRAKEGLFKCSRNGAHHRCRGRAYIQIVGAKSVVTAISAAEWHAIESAEGDDVLYDLGILSRAIGELNATPSLERAS
jgi:hypothetical protein